VFFDFAILQKNNHIFLFSDEKIILIRISVERKNAPIHTFKNAERQPVLHNYNSDFKYFIPISGVRSGVLHFRTPALF